MENRERKLVVIGAGLVGSVMACYLAKEGYSVDLLERRPDPRLNDIDSGRSINLALSRRGIAALEEIEMASHVENYIIPMHGRMMHDIKGGLKFQAYGKEGQYINSVSRNGLNEVLITEAERLGCRVHFNKTVHDVDFEESSVTTSDGTKYSAEYLIAADGAFSAIRSTMMREPRFDYTQDYVDYGYKELTLPADGLGKHKMDINALHIWPRGNFMLIALPNMDGSYTCTLFLPFEGPVSFETLNSDEEILSFFTEHFPDVIPLIPELLQDFHDNPTSSLVTIRCYPWKKGNTLLIGDASHAIVPFYGQGMNAGFEDCRILMQLVRAHNHDWDSAMEEFQELRKPDAEAIADLALQNFIEMRDLVADDDFLLRKKIEARLHEEYPNRWVPLYTMVTFSDHMRYSEAMSKGLQQKEIMDRVMARENIEHLWETMDLTTIIAELEN